METTQFGVEIEPRGKHQLPETMAVILEGTAGQVRESVRRAALIEQVEPFGSALVGEAVAQVVAAGVLPLDPEKVSGREPYEELARREESARQAEIERNAETEAWREALTRLAHLPAPRTKFGRLVVVGLALLVGTGVWLALAYLLTMSLEAIVGDLLELVNDAQHLTSFLVAAVGGALFAGLLVWPVTCASLVAPRWLTARLKVVYVAAEILASVAFGLIRGVLSFESAAWSLYELAFVGIHIATTSAFAGLMRREDRLVRRRSIFAAELADRAAALTRAEERLRLTRQAVAAQAAAIVEREEGEERQKRATDLAAKSAHREYLVATAELANAALGEGSSSGGRREE